MSWFWLKGRSCKTFDIVESINLCFLNINLGRGCSLTAPPPSVCPWCFVIKSSHLFETSVGDSLQFNSIVYFKCWVSSLVDSEKYIMAITILRITIINVDLVFFHGSHECKRWSLSSNQCTTATLSVLQIYHQQEWCFRSQLWFPQDR